MHHRITEPCVSNIWSSRYVSFSRAAIRLKSFHTAGTHIRATSQVDGGHGTQHKQTQGDTGQQLDTVVRVAGSEEASSVQRAAQQLLDSCQGNAVAAMKALLKASGSMGEY
jgi:hypothetical protein